MTREEKMNWLKNATVAQVLEQYRKYTIAYDKAWTYGGREKMNEYLKLRELCEAELIERINM